MALLLAQSALEISLQQGGYETVVSFMDRNFKRQGFDFLPGLEPEELDMAEFMVDSEFQAIERHGPCKIDPFSKRMLMVNGFRVAKKAEQVSRLLTGFRPLVPPRIAADKVAICEYGYSVISAEPSFIENRLYAADLANYALRNLYPTKHPGVSLQEQGAAANYWSLGIYVGFIALERAEVEQLTL